MPGDPETMAETSGATVVAPARVPLAERGINALPDDLLRRVLSCLNAREAVQTCVLSKLWRNLWRDARRIYVSWRAFEIQNRGCDYRCRSLLKKFVSRLLMLRNAVPLDEFRLFSYIDGDTPYPDYAQSNLWIRHALLCEARSVEIFLWEEGDKLELNRAMFTSEHLTRLRLYRVILPKGFFRQLQTGCKALECLILQDCPIDDIEIASQTLKILSIGTDCWFDSLQASLSLPNLIHLGFFQKTTFAHSSDYKTIPLVKNMDLLKTAYVDLHKFKGLTVGDIRQFVLGLSGVTKLEFSFGSGQEELMMGMDLQWCPKFNNLKFLSLGNWYLDANFYGLIAFLQKSPNLEHLTLNLKRKQHAEVPGALMGGAVNRSFTCKHLKTVEIICSKKDPAVHSLREFLLEGGISDGQIHIKH